MAKTAPRTFANAPEMKACHRMTFTLYSNLEGPLLDVVAHCGYCIGRLQTHEPSVSEQEYSGD